MSNHFDSVAKDWDKNLIHKQRTEAIAAELSLLIKGKPYASALEFGAGTGLLSIRMKDAFTEITLMDSSKGMVEVAHESIRNLGNPHLHPLLFDLEKEDYLTKTFDIIYSQMALHHVNNIEQILYKLSKLLNRGGMLVIADLYHEDGSFHDGDFHGHFGFDPNELAKILSKLGFTQIQHKQCFEIIREPEPNKKFPVFILNGIID